MSSERPYHEHSRRFFDQYRAADFEQAHRDWLPLMPDQHGLALDVSAGSGRDARKIRYGSADLAINN